ncbi:MAG: dUTP diphosphatase [Spirochaetaceae bacterium]|nr:MAG: dUTP diphosphatase [Spirochaetaceae bacterium]
MQVACEAADGCEPVYATNGAAGADLKANLREALDVSPRQRVRVPTGVRVALPHGFEAQVRPRSGLADRYGVTVLNAPGTIDSDYRGEIQVILVNLGDEVFRIEPGDRIAQLVVAPVTRALFHAGPLSETPRGHGGFGSTGA